MSHHFCTGSCNGKSDEVGVCETKGCNMEGRPLETCNCTDGFHGADQDLTDDYAENDTF